MILTYRRHELTHHLAEQGWLPRLLGLQTNPELDLTKTLERLESIPPLWICHSEQDSIVSPQNNQSPDRLAYVLVCAQIPVECSTEFAKAVGKRFPESPLLLTVKPGDHMWTDALSMSEPWVQEGCQFVNQFWL